MIRIPWTEACPTEEHEHYHVKTGVKITQTKTGPYCLNCYRFHPKDEKCWFPTHTNLRTCIQCQRSHAEDEACSRILARAILGAEASGHSVLELIGNLSKGNQEAFERIFNAPAYRMGASYEVTIEDMLEEAIAEKLQ